MASDATTWDPADTVMMLHLDGTDTSTTITDEAGNLSFSCTGTAQIDTAQSKFGGASLYLDGGSDYISASDPGTVADFGTGDFTIDFWTRVSTTQNAQYAFDWGSADDVSFNFGNSNQVFFELENTATQFGTYTHTNNVWTHHAIVRSSGTVYVFTDGVAQGTPTSKTDNVVITGDFYIGARYGGSDFWGKGQDAWIDEFRVCKTAVWTSGFTPPTAPYTQPTSPGKFFSIPLEEAYMAGPTLFRPDGIATGLQGYWKLDEASGASRLDSSGNSNTLTDNNTVGIVAQDYWNTGENSADFGGTNQYLDVTSSDFDITGSFSIVAFVKKDVTGTQIVLSKDDIGDGYGMRVASTGEVSIYVDGNQHQTTDQLSVGKWHHVAGVYDTTANVVNIYFDGNLVDTGAETNDPADTGSVLYLGRNAGGNYWNGLQKDVAVWNVALTPLQIKSLAMGVSLESAAYRPDTVGTQPDAYWKMNEVSGPLTDSAGSNDASQTGTVPRGGGYVEGVGLDMDGAVGKYFTVSNASGDFDFGTGDFSMACWIKPTTTGDSKWLDSGAGAGDLSMGIDSNTTLRIGLDETAKDFTSFFTSGANPWMHIAVVRNSGTLYAYKDGEAFGNTASSENVALTGNLRICQNDSGAERQTGQLADLAVWKGYALGTDEVLGLASAMPIQQSGIVSYWNMNGANAAGETDQIGSNDLSNNSGGAGIATTTGIVDEARDLELDDSEYFSAPNDSSIDITRDLTILGWVKPESTVVATMFDKDYANDGYGMVISGGNFLFYVNNDSDTSSSTVTNGQWSHFAGVYDGALKAVWFDGDLEGSGAYSTDPADTTTGLNIGASLTPSAYFDGVADEWVLATRWFREEEIKTAYINGLNGVVVTNEPIPTGNTGGFFAIL